MSLALLPTPLERADRLSAAYGGPTIWVKRDDLTGFGLSGNKVRKLEFHLAAAIADRADTVITCGAAQSNHCRATALAAARLGLRTHLVLRTGDGAPPSDVTGNHLLQRLAGATVEFVDADGYLARDEVMADAARRVATAGGRAWVIPEGASDALGMWGFVLAMQELADQAAMLPRSPAAVWHAASSGGTTAGLCWAADRLGLDTAVIGSSVGETVGELTRRVEEIWREAAASTGAAMPSPRVELIDRYVGLGYGRTTTEELAVQAEATALTGQLFDPTYTGKALFGLRAEIESGRFSSDDHVVFWHTGGGFAAFAHDFAGALDGGVSGPPSS